MIAKQLHDNPQSKNLYLSIPYSKRRMDSATKRSTSRLLRSIPHVPSLKRHEISENYYGAKKLRGKIKTFHSKLETGVPVTDRKIAERDLREWLDVLHQTSAETGFREGPLVGYLIKRESNQKS